MEANTVAPLAGARIEIVMIDIIVTHLKMSLPSRERGLKFLLLKTTQRNKRVAPLAGARIEIQIQSDQSCGHVVAPLAGARIEISLLLSTICRVLSVSAK